MSHTVLRVARPASAASFHARWFSRRGRPAIASMLVCTALVGALVSPQEAQAVAVSLNTTTLSGMAGRFEFVLFDGDGVANNSVVVSNITSNGTFVGTDCSLGCAVGPSAFTIDDALGIGQFLYDLTLGSFLNFDLDFTSNFGGGTPDRLALSLLDPSTNFSLVSTDLTFPDDALFTVDLTGAGVVQIAALTDPAVGISVGQAAAIPEPGSLGLVVGALLLLFRRRVVSAMRGSNFG